MSMSTKAEVDRLLDEAEAAGACLVPPGGTRGPLGQRLRRRALAGELVSPYRGLYVRAARWEGLDPGERDLWAMRALSGAHPDWVFCGVSAARAHGLWLPWRLAGILCVAHLAGPASVRRGSRSPVSGIRWRGEPVSGCATVAGARVTPLDETAVDCLRELPFPEGLGVADSWARITGMSREALLERVERLGARRRGVGQARAAASHADGRSENGGESFARARMIELGYEEPDLQAEFADPLEPWRTMRVDYLWERPDGTRVVGELDGMGKYVDPALTGGLTSEGVRAKERLRESRLAMPGVAVMRFSMADVCDPDRFARLLSLYGVPRRPE